MDRQAFRSFVWKGELNDNPIAVLGGAKVGYSRRNVRQRRERLTDITATRTTENGGESECR